MAKKQKERPLDTLTPTCYHEAGHAIGAYLAGQPILRARVGDRGVAEGANKAQTQPLIQHVGSGDYRLAYQTLFVTISSVCGEDIGKKHLLPHFWPSTIGDFVHISSFLWALRSRDDQWIRATREDLLSGDYQSQSHRDELLDIVYRLHDDACVRFAQPEVKIATVALATSFRDRAQRGEYEMTGEMLTQKLSPIIGDMYRSIGTPEWFGQLLMTWGYSAITEEEVREQFRQMDALAEAQRSMREGP
jgi:hypothetical protein